MVAVAVKRTAHPQQEAVAVDNYMGAAILVILAALKVEIRIVLMV